MHAGRSGACAHISVSSKRGQGDSPCTRPCLQGVVCYTQTDTERKSKENSLPVDDCFHEDFRGCWGDMRAPVFGALITTQQSFVGRSHAAYCGRSFIRSVLLFLLRCIEPNTAARCQPYRHSGLINILTSCLNTKKASLKKSGVLLISQQISKGDLFMAYAIMRINKCKMGAVGRLEKHHEREKEKYKSNPDIDLSQSHNNFHLKTPTGSYRSMILQRIDRKSVV